MNAHNIIDIIVTHTIEDFSTFISTVLGAAAMFAIHKVRDLFKEHKRKKHNSIPGLIASDMQVYQTLTELLVSAQADRAFVLQFHNGVYYVNEGNQMKLSCSHEIVREGISKEQGDMQEMLTSRMAITLHDILTGKTSEFLVYEDASAHPNYFFQLLRDQGVKILVAHPMMDNEVVEGIVALTYLNKHNYEDVKIAFNPEDLLVQATHKIGFTLRGKG